LSKPWLAAPTPVLVSVFLVPVFLVSVFLVPVFLVSVFLVPVPGLVSVFLVPVLLVPVLPTSCSSRPSIGAGGM